MGSLKRKSSSLGASAASSKRPPAAARDDASAGAAVANGYSSGRRPSSSSSPLVAAASPPVSAAVEASCNGAFVVAKASEDFCPSASASSLLDSRSVVPLKELAPSENQSIHPADSQEQEAETVIVPVDSSHSRNLGPLTPNHAGWFSWNSIHALERQGLPEFFNSKSKLKTPTFYKEYRNLLMQKYLENPDKVFTLADVEIDQKGGQLEAIRRIFESLNHWGLLNSRALQHAEAEKPRKSNALAVENVSGQPEWSLTSSLYRFDNQVTFSSRRPAIVERVVTTAAMTESMPADLQGGAQGMSVEYHCNSCSADCSKKRFHCQKQADFDLCPECYNEEKFTAGITSTDFILMEAATDANSNGGWSDQETLLLLEALEMFGDNFSEIAEHVGTKTKAQCILHFIRLPIEDPFLEAVEPNTLSHALTTADSHGNTKNSSSATEGEDRDEKSMAQFDTSAQQEDSISISCNEDHMDMSATNEKSVSATRAIMAAAEAAGLFASDKQLALNECGNPVMTLVAFLAALVEPDTVATSAQAALKVLADHASALQLADENSFHLELESVLADPMKEPAVDRPTEEVTQSELQSDAIEMRDTDTDRKDCSDKGVVNTEEDVVAEASSLVRVKSAARTALAAAAVKAKFLADQEEWEILRLSAFVVDSQMKKIETKLKLFRELDAALEKEHNLLDRSRERLLLERLQISATRTVQSSVPASRHHTNLNTTMMGGPRPHSLSSRPVGFASSPPVPVRPPRTLGPTDYSRGPPTVHHGMNMAPMRPVYYNNTQL